MKKNTWEILPRKESRTSTGQIPLFLRVRINGHYFKHSLGITIPEVKYWDEKHIQIRKNPAFDPWEANKVLTAIAKKVSGVINNAIIHDQVLTKEDFTNRYFGANLSSLDSFYDFATREIKQMEQTNFARETIRSYNSYISKLKKYKSSLLFCDISKVFISKLDVYLVSIGNQQNTRQKMFGFLNTMLNKAKKEGIIQENILYQNAPVKKKEGQRAFLTSEELKALEKLKPESKNLQIVLKYFLFACYTGLRFTDLRNFRFKDIVDIDGQVHTRLIMHKTKDEVTIPLIRKAQALIPEKGFPNQRVFKVRCNQVSNRDLKVLMNLAKIDKSISMHCARHTFATVALSLGIDIMVISKILGHKELGTTRIYAKLQDKRKIEEMKKWETA